MEILSTNNMTILVSHEDYSEIPKNIYMNGKYPSIKHEGYPIRLHAFIFKNRMEMEVSDTEVIDHKNGNKLDCRRENLRLLTYSQNAQNRFFMSTSKSGFRGVYKASCGPRWQVYCGTKYIGTYDEPEEGAIAYDKYIIKYIQRDNPTNFEYSEHDKDEIFQSNFAPMETKKRNPDMLGIYWKEEGEKYELRVYGKTKGMFRELDEAQKVRDELYAAANKKKEEDRLSLKILTNDAGEAIIPLTGKTGTGKFTVVDHEHWHDLVKTSWYLGNHGYPSSRRDGKLWTIHEYLTRNQERNPRFIVVDHKDTNTLNNRLDNLRLVTRKENAKNISEESRKKASERQTGTIQPRHNRKNSEDHHLPKYVSCIRGKTEQGYTVQHHPGVQTKKFTSRKLTMPEKLKLALDYLNTCTVLKPTES